MYPRILDFPFSLNKSFFLFGPRGTGKTTLLKKKCPKAFYLDLLNMKNYQDLLANPNLLAKLIPDNFNEWIIIDEIQKIPELLNEVHRLIEEKKYKFILTGSSARNLRKKGVNLLAGRALTFSLYPLTAFELGKDFDISKSLNLGHLPSVYAEKNPKLYLNSYINTYLREEVLQEGLVRKLSVFSKFLEIASFSQGSLLNMSEIAREIGIDNKTIENYFVILEDLLIGVRIPVFTKRAKRRMVTHPKFYFFDTGIYRTLRPAGPLDSKEEIDGTSLETLFFQELRAINDYFQLEYQIFFWRSATNLEVDFVLYSNNNFMAFEIKRSARFSNKDFSGLRAFKNDYPEAKLFFLYGGERIEYHEGITVLPIQQAIINLHKILKGEMIN